MTPSSPVVMPSRGRRAGRFLVLILLLAAAGFGAVYAVLDNKHVRRLVFREGRSRPPRSEPYSLRSLTLGRRDQALAAGDLEEAAAIHALLAQEAVRRARAVYDAWMPLRDPRTRLFPQSLDKPEWNYRNTAADFFCFMFHAALYTDAANAPLLRETLAAETALAPAGALCQPVDWKTGRPVREDEAERLFASSEYVKDGLLSLYEAYGDPQVLARMRQIMDALLAHSHHATKFGPIADGRSEVNGEMLQVLGRLSLVAPDAPAYPEMAARITDAVLGQMLPASHGLPAHTFDYTRGEIVRAKAQFRDHGNELAGGLSELYALAVARRGDPVWAARADRWAEPLARMFELILAHGVNAQGLIINSLDPATLTPVDARASDNWGYVLNGVLLFAEAAERHGRIAPERLQALRAGADRIVAAVAATDGLAWEGASHDGYADTLESALYYAAYRPQAAPTLLPWVDRQIGILFGMQKDDGFVARHYLDGNFIRTALMYADLRSGGWGVDPWDAETRVGLAAGADGEAVLVVESADGYTGTLGPLRPVTGLARALPWDWPRLNSWPAWVPPAHLRAVKAVTGAATAPSPEELARGWRITVPPGGRLVLRLQTGAGA